MKTTLINLAAAVLISGIQACSSGKSESNSTITTELIPVKVIDIQKENINTIIHTSGQFTTNDETVLSFKTSGIISRITVKEGDFVKKGQLLAMLNLTEIEAQVKQAKVAFEKLQRDYQRASNLYKDSVATLEQVQNIKTELEVAQQDLASAMFNLSHSEIRALKDGYVLKKLVNEGEYINGGTPVLETNGAGKSGWILKVGLSDREWSSIKIGDKATLETDAYPGKKVQAIVVRKSEATDASSGAFMAELVVTDLKGISLASGLFGRAQIFASQQMELWAIPYEALLDGNGNSGFVFTTDGQKAKRVAVEVFSIGKDKIYISKGLENTAKLIVAGSPYLKENSSVTVIQ